MGRRNASGSSDSKGEQAPGPPAGIDDPLADQVEWTPVKPGGTNFRTHALVAAGADEVRFAISRAATAVSLVFFWTGVGSGLLAAWAYAHPASQVRGEPAPAISISCLAVAFLIAGPILHRKWSTPIHFCRSCGLFWKGRADASALLPAEVEAHPDVIRLDDIHALQILRERCYVRKGADYDSHELNLVLRDRQRVSVVDHKNIPRLREDAALLAEFLDVPVWDATLQQEDSHGTS